MCVVCVLHVYYVCITGVLSVYYMCIACSQLHVVWGLGRTPGRLKRFRSSVFDTLTLGQKVPTSLRITSRSRLFDRGHGFVIFTFFLDSTSWHVDMTASMHFVLCMYVAANTSQKSGSNRWKTFCTKPCHNFCIGAKSLTRIGFGDTRL